MASTPTLTLANPTEAERIRLAEGTFPQWGGGLDIKTYLARETDSIGPLNRDGGLQGWLLTEAGAAPDHRPLLTSCDTLRKRALVRESDGSVRDVLAQGVASVFTPEQQRGKGYAGRMMGLLSETLKARANEEGDQQALFSILFSDVGKEIYAKRGWKALESTHLKFPVDAARDYPVSPDVKYITKADISELTAIDEKLLRQRLASQPQETGRTQVAIIPDENHMLWHFAREDLKAQNLWPSVPLPDIHGAIVTVPSSKSRVWALWSRKLRSEDVSKNSVYFLRLVVESPEKVSDEEFDEALEKIVDSARQYAKENHCGKVQCWTPDKRTRAAVEKRPGLEAEYVVRESDSIVSLNWFGEGSVDDVDWVIPEQYTWC
ncbi:hypothetical protein CC79DRAFT_580446 [Sarocladium strictum]